MTQKFTKKELERLGCTDGNIKLVMEYQRKLPILIENEEVSGFLCKCKRII